MQIHIIECILALKIKQSRTKNWQVEDSVEAARKHIFWKILPEICESDSPEMLLSCSDDKCVCNHIDESSLLSKHILPSFLTKERKQSNHINQEVVETPKIAFNDPKQSREYRGWYPLYFSCVSKADIDVKYISALALDVAKSGCCRHLDRRLFNPCHIFCMQKNPRVEIYRAIKQQIPTISRFDSANKQIPLHLALQCCENLDFIKELIDDNPMGLKKADIHGNNVLHYAMRNTTVNSLKIQEYIYRTDPSLSLVQNSFGMTPLHVSLSYDVSCCNYAIQVFYCPSVDLFIHLYTH